jgi:uncharacterized protein (TIGR02186 family)
MIRAASFALMLLALFSITAIAAEPATQEQVQSDVSTREIAIESNFTGIEILIFGSIDFSDEQTPADANYGVITVVRGPTEPVAVTRKHRIFGIWVNDPGKSFATAPGFYAVLSSRPFRSIASDDTLKQLGIGLVNVDFGRYTRGDHTDDGYRDALIRLRTEEGLFQEHDDGVSFIGRSLFRANVTLPVNVPVGHYTADVYLFRDGQLVSKNVSGLYVNKVGFERLVYSLAYQHPFFYGLLAVVLAVLAGLTGWYAFRRD